MHDVDNGRIRHQVATPQIRGILSDGAFHYAGAAMVGHLRFYDARTAWGVIAGEDGCLYMVRGDQLPGPPPREGERVTFEPLAVAGGLRAIDVQRVSAVRRGATGGAAR